MTPKQKKFIELYSGNATEAATLAGFSPKTAYSQGQRLLKNVEIVEQIRQRENKYISTIAADRQERQGFWTSLMRNPEERTSDRLKASELLAKSEGDFLERVETNALRIPDIKVVFLENRNQDEED